MSKQPTIPVEYIERRAREVIGDKLERVEITPRVRRSERITFYFADKCRITLSNDSYRDPDAVRAHALLLFNQWELGAVVALIQVAVPDAEINARTSPRQHDGIFWVDAKRGDLWVALQWSPRSGLWGVSVNNEDTGYGEACDESFEAKGDAMRRAIELLQGGNDAR